MSLVNDALKRAKEAQDKQAATPLLGAPLHTTTPSTSSKNWIVVLLSSLALLALLAAIVIGGLYWFRLPSPTPTKTVPEHSASAPTAIPNTTGQTPPPPKIADTAPPPTPEIIPVPTALPPTPPVDLKLQGILFSASKPAAIINGRTVWVGSRFSGVIVSAIEPDRVTVLYSNQPIVIRLP